MINVVLKIHVSVQPNPRNFGRLSSSVLSIHILNNMEQHQFSCGSIIEKSPFSTELFRSDNIELIHWDCRGWYYHKDTYTLFQISQGSFWGKWWKTKVIEHYPSGRGNASGWFEWDSPDIIHFNAKFSWLKNIFNHRNHSTPYTSL